MGIIKIFLASSEELKTDRKEFEIFINRENKQWKDRNVFFELIIWEDFLDALSPTRLQDEYNKVIKECDIFILLFHTKVGMYSEEEFGTAVGQFQKTNKPFIYTYFKEADIDKLEDSVKRFQEKLNQLGHFYTKYKNTEGLLLHFKYQLDKLYAHHFTTMEAPKGQMVQYAEKIYNIDHIDNATFN